MQRPRPEPEALERVAAVLSGYQGAEDVGAVVLETVARVKELNPSAVYCCDPVMGDVGRGMFVRPGIPEMMRDHVVPAADVITPNHFELDFLSGRETRTVADVLDAKPLSTPLTVADCCLVTDGGGAIVVTSLERARDLPKPPIVVLGYGESTTNASMSAVDDLTVTGAVASGRAAFARAGLTPAAVRPFPP